jgi:hypothetical protein
VGNERQYMIRPAKQGEAGEIRRMVYTARINPMGLDWRRFVVAVDPDGRLIGCGQVKTHRDGRTNWRRLWCGQRIKNAALPVPSSVI